MKAVIGILMLSCFQLVGQADSLGSTEKPLLVFVGGFGQTKGSVKKLMKRLKTDYPKLEAYDILAFSHLNSAKSITRKINKLDPEHLTLACFSMGANNGLNVASSMDRDFDFALIDPWFLSSNWQTKDSLANDDFKQAINALPQNSMIVYGSDFVIKNNQDLSKISGPFGTKNCKDCYAYLRQVWQGQNKVFRSGAGHKYFPELYIKQFLPEIKEAVESEKLSEDDIGI